MAIQAIIRLQLIHRIKKRQLSHVLLVCLHIGKCHLDCVMHQPLCMLAILCSIMCYGVGIINFLELNLLPTPDRVLINCFSFFFRKGCLVFFWVSLWIHWVLRISVGFSFWWGFLWVYLSIFLSRLALVKIFGKFRYYFFNWS